MGIHLLHCVHGNECIRTHDVVCDTFIAIVQDAYCNLNLGLAIKARGYKGVGQEGTQESHFMFLGV
jgi:hypothetical protein